MSDLPQRSMRDDEIKHRYAAQESAISLIEKRVDQLDAWANENAVKKDYSSAGSQQKSAVDLHAAIAIIKDALFPHSHKMSGFSWIHNDTCAGCELDDWLKRNKGADRG